MQNKLNRKITINMIIQAALFVALVIIDRLTKIIVVNGLKGKEPISIIKDVLELRYLENSGAAFGIFQNMQWMFYIITAIVLIAVVIIWITINRKLRTYCGQIVEGTQIPDTFKFKTYNNALFLNYLLPILAAGAIGNLIDRLTTKYVVDFIYFKIIDFPIFNFADICVTLTAFALIIFFIFVYRDDPNFSIFGSSKKSTEKKTNE